MGRIVYILGWEDKTPGEATQKTQKGTDLTRRSVRPGGSREMTLGTGSSKAWGDGGYQPT